VSLIHGMLQPPSALFPGLDANGCPVSRASSSPYIVLLSTAAPGIFTANGTASGDAVVLNQDYSLDGPTNPSVARFSSVVLRNWNRTDFAVCRRPDLSEQPPSGDVAGRRGVGNLGAQLLYAGQAPYFMTGVDQINIVIPTASPTGSVPLSLLVNGVFSPPRVTIAVK
jgi:uncharacterized protein (TIGR03437 family)